MPEATPKHSAFEQALRFLDRRAYSEAELRRKLTRFPYLEAEISAAIAECRRRRYVNDDELARELVENLLARGNGPRLIRLKLRRRGLPTDQLGALPESTATAELTAAQIAAAGKLRLLDRETDPRKKREKLYRFLATRGFSAPVISQVISASVDASAPDDDISHF